MLSFSDTVGRWPERGWYSIPFILDLTAVFVKFVIYCVFKIGSDAPSWTRTLSLSLVLDTCLAECRYCLMQSLSNSRLLRSAGDSSSSDEGVFSSCLRRCHEQYPARACALAGLEHTRLLHQCPSRINLEHKTGRQSLTLG